jgi:hypothetical protein
MFHRLGDSFGLYRAIGSNVGNQPVSFALYQDILLRFNAPFLDYSNGLVLGVFLQDFFGRVE